MSKIGYISIIAVIAALAGLMFWLSKSPNGVQTPPPPPPPDYQKQQIQLFWKSMVTAAGMPPLGNPKAPWTVMEVGDFQCPNCGDAKQLVEDSILNSRGRAKMYFMNYPIQRLHPHAMDAAEAALSAMAQGKFWPMYDLMYAHQDELVPSEIQYYAQQQIPGFDGKRFQSDMATHKYMKTLAGQVEMMRQINVDTVPTLFVRDPKGNVTWYVGTAGEQNTLGIIAYAAKLPWGGGIGKDAATQMVKEHHEKIYNKTVFGS